MLMLHAPRSIKKMKSMNEQDKDYLATYNIHDFDIPLTSVDTVIFAIIKGELNVLVVERNEHPYQSKLALPGGFIDLKKDENIDATAYRKLFEKTGVKSPYLEQVETIGNQKRDIRGFSVTVLYYALIDSKKFKQQASAQKSHWLPFALLKAKDLAFDHQLLIEKAYFRLKDKCCYTALPVELMPELFTLTELQTTFETILGKKLPIKSFRRRILAANILQATDKSKLSGKRHAQLFKSTGLDRHYYFPRTLLL
jgi:ADP-ribose pyrophosphatase YjhB (NUDIX family)